METKIDLTDLEKEKSIDKEIEKGIERVHNFDPSKYIELTLLKRITLLLNKLVHQKGEKQ